MAGGPGRCAAAPCALVSDMMVAVRGGQGTSMTMHRLPRKRYEAARSRAGTLCGSVARQPCLFVEDGRSGGILWNVHRGRPGQRFIIGEQRPNRTRDVDVRAPKAEQSMRCPACKR